MTGSDNPIPSTTTLAKNRWIPRIWGPVYRGVQEMNASGQSGTSYFEEDDGAEYVSSDVFSKLKFDDLRKVHKDQTVFAVSESDLNKRVQYKSVDQFVRDRDGGNQAPLSKIEAAQLLERQQKEKEQLIMNKQHRDFMLQKEYESKQQAVRAAFLQLRNWMCVYKIL